MKVDLFVTDILLGLFTTVTSSKLTLIFPTIGIPNASSSALTTSNTVFVTNQSISKKHDLLSCEIGKI